MGFISLKLVSLIVGPQGVAEIGQINSFILILTQLSTLGISNGVINFVTLYGNRPKYSSIFIKGSLGITFLVSSIIFLILIAIPDKISLFVFHTKTKYWIIYLLSIIQYTLAFNAIILSVVNGKKEFKIFSNINIFTSVFGVSLLVILVYLFDINGAIIGTVILPLFSFGYYWLFYENKFLIFSDIFSVFENLSKKIVTKYLNFSAIALASSLCTPLVLFYLRSYIIDNYGFNLAGNWEAMNRISNVYMALFSTLFTVYLLPKFSENLGDRELNKTLMDIFKITNVVLIIILCLLLVSKSLIIQLLLSSRFRYVENLFVWQIVGDYFKMNSWILSILMISKQLVKKFIFIEVLTASFFLVISKYFLGIYGLVGASIGYSISSFFTLLLLFIFNYKNLIFTK